MGAPCGSARHRVQAFRAPLAGWEGLAAPTEAVTGRIIFVYLATLARRGERGAAGDWRGGEGGCCAAAGTSPFPPGPLSTMVA